MQVGMGLTERAGRGWAMVTAPSGGRLSGTQVTGTYRPSRYGNGAPAWVRRQSQRTPQLAGPTGRPG